MVNPLHNLLNIYDVGSSDSEALFKYKILPVSLAVLAVFRSVWLWNNWIDTKTEYTNKNKHCLDICSILLFAFYFQRHIYILLFRFSFIIRFCCFLSLNQFPYQTTSYHLDDCFDLQTHCAIYIVYWILSLCSFWEFISIVFYLKCFSYLHNENN